MFCSGIETLTGLQPVLITVISNRIIINQEKMSGRKIVFQTTLLRKKLMIALFADSIDDCPSNCFGNGDCVSGTCHCFLGFKGPDCGRGESHPHAIMSLLIDIILILNVLGSDQIILTARTKQFQSCNYFLLHFRPFLLN